MKKISLNITGMHCTACETLITESLADAGIKVVKISQESGKTEISFDEKKTDLTNIKRIIQSEGYGVE